MEKDLSKQRNSKDKIINNEGKKLLEICKTNNLIILNGRCGKDKCAGEIMFREKSVIDYSIASVNCLSFIEGFSISEQDCLYSNGHSLLSTVLKLKYKIRNIKNSKTKVIRNKRLKWNQNKSKNFINNIDRSKLDYINANIETVKANINNVNEETINSISSDISALFSESSDKTYPIEQLAINPKNDRKHKPWFGINCQNGRKNTTLQEGSLI